MRHGRPDFGGPDLGRPAAERPGPGRQPDGWLPRPPGSLRRPKGDVRTAVLSVLADGPHNGYQVISEIFERSGGAWRPSPGAIYPALAQLAADGLIATEESGRRRTSSLTAAGRAYVDANAELTHGVWETIGQEENRQVPGLFAVAARLGGGIVQVAEAGTPGQIQAAERLLEQTRRSLYLILAGEGADEPEQR